jgi:hypothetical protein
LIPQNIWRGKGFELATMHVDIEKYVIAMKNLTWNSENKFHFSCQPGGRVDGITTPRHLV